MTRRSTMRVVPEVHEHSRGARAEELLCVWCVFSLLSEKGSEQRRVPIEQLCRRGGRGCFTLPKARISVSFFLSSFQREGGTQACCVARRFLERRRAVHDGLLCRFKLGCHPSLSLPTASSAHLCVSFLSVKERERRRYVACGRCLWEAIELAATTAAESSIVGRGLPSLDPVARVLSSTICQRRGAS